MCEFCNGLDNPADGLKVVEACAEYAVGVYSGRKPKVFA